MNWWLVLSAHIQWPSRTSTPSQSENIYKSCYCGLFSLARMYIGPSRTNTPSQSEIFYQAVIVACSLCSYVCVALPGPAHPPKVKYSIKLLLWLVLSARMYIGPSRTNTPSQSEIFHQAGIVASSLCSYVCVALPGPAHPPKVKYSLKSCYCGLLSLLVCRYWSSRTSTPSQIEIFHQAVIVACSLCSYVYWTFKDQHTLPK